MYKDDISAGNLGRTAQDSNHVAHYALEADGFLIDKEQMTFTLLNSEELNYCSDAGANWCVITRPLYPTVLSKMCILNLYVDNKAYVEYCQTIVNIDTILPLATYIPPNNWVVISRETLAFKIRCMIEGQGILHNVNTKPHMDVLNMPHSVRQDLDK